MKRFVLLLSLTALCISFFVGCSEGNKSSKEVYIYVLNKDYDATINAEWYSARKTKGGISGIELKKYTWIHLREKAQGDTITIGVEGNKFDVATSALSLLTPEQFEAALKGGDPDSPHYLKGLHKYIDKHNVLLLSDGSVPQPTAKSDSSDFMYICIPALLLVFIGFLCSRMEDGSLVLPVIGLILMLSQFVILLFIISGTGVSIHDLGNFILGALFIGLLVALANAYAGLTMCSAIIRHTNLQIRGKTILISIGIGFASLIAYAVIIQFGFGIGEKSEYYGPLLIIGYILGLLVGVTYFILTLYKQKPEAIKAHFLLVTIALLTILFASAIAIIIFIWLIWYATHKVLIAPGGNLLGSTSPNNGNCCSNCRLYNQSTKECTQFHKFIENPYKERSCCTW